MLENRIRTFIREHSLIREGDRVLVAYSGGADSTCLLMILHKFFPAAQAVYVNHQLRGRESQKEEKFVGDFCKKNKIPLFVEHIRWNSIPANLEESARKRRYRHLEKVAVEHGFQKIALAHHKDDVVETFLIRLIRGSGTQGLGRMLPKRGRYIRPLLECSRSEVLAYLKENQIAFFKDTSNAKLQFTRNKIRNKLIPYISRNFNPAFPSSVERASRWIQEQNELMTELLSPYEALMDYQKDRWILKRDSFLALSGPLQKAVMRMYLAKMDPDLRLSARSLQRLIKAIQIGTSFELPGFLKMHSGDHRCTFVIKQTGTGLLEVDVPSVGSYRFPPASVTLKFSVTRSRASSNPNIAMLDADAATFPLYIRNWKSGDFFKPLGMTGRKKLSDYFIDKRIPREKRKSIPLVFKDDDLLWISGHQIHHDYRITSSTKRVLRIEAKRLV